MDYFIWVEPQGTVKEDKQSVITDLASRYDGPVFTPHITILAPMSHLTSKEMRKRAALLASKLKPYTLTFNRIEMFDEEYRALFILYQQTDEALHPSFLAEEIMEYKSTREHMPHLSLYYGHKTEDEKKQMIDTISTDLTQSVLIDRLYLYSSSGPIDTWKKEEEFMLGK